VTWVAVAVVGAAGALARFALIGALAEAGARAGFPLGTLAVNVSGSFLLGLLTGLSVGGDDLLVWGTALLGAYTTFSTWMLETERLAEDGATLAAAANIGLSLLAGLLAAAGGWALGGAL
jgi:CrcB protein